MPVYTRKEDDAGKIGFSVFLPALDEVIEPDTFLDGENEAKEATAKKALARVRQLRTH